MLTTGGLICKTKSLTLNFFLERKKSQARIKLANNDFRKNSIMKNEYSIANVIGSSILFLFRHFWCVMNSENFLSCTRCMILVS